MKMLLRAFCSLLLASQLSVLPAPTFAQVDGQQQNLAIQELDTLVGKQVIAQQAPLCQPGTHTVVFSYAGKVAKVISVMGMAQLE